MTITEFIALCVELTIDPAIALESTEVRDAIRANDRGALIRILNSQF